MSKLCPVCEWRKVAARKQFVNNYNTKICWSCEQKKKIWEKESVEE